MSHIHMVRHAKPLARFGSALDPGLDEAGRRQAEVMAAKLGPKGPLPILTSPLRRTRETAHALELRWNILASAEPRISEIPSPTDSLSEREDWLRDIMRRRWSELDPNLRTWREEVLTALTELGEDTVVMSHFIAINVAVGSALGDDRLVCCQPDHCSCTVFELTDGKLRLVELGVEVTTRIL